MTENRGRKRQAAIFVPLLVALAGLSLALVVSAGEGSASAPRQPGGQVHHGRAPGSWSEPDTAVAVTGQSVLGTDERVQVTDTTALPFRLIAFLGIYDARDEFAGHCTGTFIGPDAILTAAHCLYDVETDTWTHSLRVVPGRNGSTEPYGFQWASDWWVPDGWIDTDGDPQWDWGIIKLTDSSLNQKLGNLWFIIGAFTTATLQNAHFQPTVAGFAGDKPLGTMWVDYRESFKAVSDSLLTYEIDTYGGESGSAVFSANLDEWFGLGIAGIHVRGGTATNEATRISAMLVDDLDEGCRQMGCTFQYYIEPGGSPSPSPSPSPRPSPSPSPTPTQPSQSFSIVGYHVCSSNTPPNCTQDQALDIGGLAYVQFTLSAEPAGNVRARATLGSKSWDVYWSPPFVGATFNTGTVIQPLDSEGMLRVDVYVDERLAGTLTYAVKRSLPRRAFAPVIAVGR